MDVRSGKVYTDKELEDLSVECHKARGHYKNLLCSKKVMKSFNDDGVPITTVLIPKRDSTKGWGLKKRERYAEILIENKYSIEDSIRCVSEFKGDLDAMDAFDKLNTLKEDSP